MEAIIKILGIAIIVAALVALGAAALQYFWAWLVPEIFPRFVEEGWITSELRFWEAFWLSTFVGLIGLRSSSSSSK